MQPITNDEAIGAATQAAVQATTQAAAQAAVQAVTVAPRFVPQASLFDLDGTLVDSEPFFELSEELLLAAWGMEIDEELKQEFFGRSAEAFFKIVESRFPDNSFNRLPLGERQALKTRAFFEAARGRITTFPATEALARELAALGMPLAIASSSTHEIIDFELEATGLSAIFPLRVSATDVAHGKPAPDVFIEAARRLGVESRRCVVFEDSLFGLLGAKAAGAFTISLPAPGSDLSSFADADILVPGGPDAINPRFLIDIISPRGNRKGF
ncbi:MAG: HAD family phosphatase [Treponema sp.]|nr:HAD family phosphatase [Treponema sp.]